MASRSASLVVVLTFVLCSSTAFRPVSSQRFPVPHLRADGYARDALQQPVTIDQFCSSCFLHDSALLDVCMLICDVASYKRNAYGDSLFEERMNKKRERPLIRLGRTE